MQTQVGLREWERGRNQLARHHRSQLERADSFCAVCLWLPFASKPRPKVIREAASLHPPLCCSWGRSFAAFASSVSWRQLCLGTWWRGQLCFLGGETGHELPDSSYLLSGEGNIRVVRQNTWNLGLFWSSVVCAHAFPLSQGCAGGKQRAPVEGFCFHSATDTAPSWCCCFQPHWPPFPRHERVISQASKAPLSPLILIFPSSFSCLW